jgi:hypothetical protein
LAAASAEFSSKPASSAFFLTASATASESLISYATSSGAPAGINLSDYP